MSNDYVNDGLDGVDDFVMPQDGPLEPMSDVPLQQPLGDNTDSKTEPSGLKPGLINYYSQYFQDVSFVDRCRNAAMNRDLGPISDLYGLIWIIFSCALMKMTIEGLLILLVQGIIHGKVPENNSATSHSNMNLMFHSLWIFILFDSLCGVLMSYRFNVSVISTLSVIGYGNVNWLYCFPIVDTVKYLMDGWVVTIVSVIMYLLITLKITHFISKQVQWEGSTTLIELGIITFVNVIKCLAIYFVL